MQAHSQNPRMKLGQDTIRQKMESHSTAVDMVWGGIRPPYPHFVYRCRMALCLMGYRKWQLGKGHRVGGPEEWVDLADMGEGWHMACRHVPPSQRRSHRAPDNLGTEQQKQTCASATASYLSGESERRNIWGHIFVAMSSPDEHSERQLGT